ncbi:hypothetical protein [Alsobacter sp. R-9]
MSMIRVTMTLARACFALLLAVAIVLSPPAMVAPVVAAQSDMATGDVHPDTPHGHHGHVHAFDDEDAPGSKSHDPLDHSHEPGTMPAASTATTASPLRMQTAIPDEVRSGMRPIGIERPPRDGASGSIRAS